MAGPTEACALLEIEMQRLSSAEVPRSASTTGAGGWEAPPRLQTLDWRKRRITLSVQVVDAPLDAEQSA